MPDPLHYNNKCIERRLDCPFAYILATIANRSLVIDVEQIIGRILRLPNTKKSAVLNLSYVITSLADFIEIYWDIENVMNVVLGISVF